MIVIIIMMISILYNIHDRTSAGRPDGALLITI